ncbi:unnamed protein product [Brassicogethes aeneus]|uniref:DNA polymerase n=1 Tax=Brassicogethes aeneus TaxID=1431903 RepID=A0A9P0FK65_BRAAE|nr:unnamed protein product [Brassicogethes aeneus]
MADSPEQVPKRQKRESSYKSKAFERFKQLKSGNRNKYEVEDVENIYDTVDEKEYTKQVLSRQDDDWIVDDDGSGYVEDGREIFDDDLDSQSIQQASKGKGTKRKKKAVAENAGRGNIHMMLSNIKPKKKEEVKIDEDDMLSELLGEIDESTPSTSTIKPKPMSQSFNLSSKKQAANDYMKTFSSFKPPSINTKITKTNKVESKFVLQEKLEANNTVTVLKEEIVSPKINKDTKKLNETELTDITMEEFSMDDFDDDMGVSEIDEIKQENVTITEEINEESLLMNQQEFMNEWVTSQETATNLIEEKVDLSTADIPLIDVDGQKVFRFYWWDAFEDPNRMKGTVYLFGKTFSEKAKKYVSCCVAVRDIQRRIFVLPTVHDNDGNAKINTYNEFNDSVMKHLQVSNFRSRFVTKRYPFNPEIPLESEYMEVRYACKEREIYVDDIYPKPKYFSKIFGINSSYLELLLLDRKIKGPCWLDVKNPQPVANPVSWCQFEINCSNPGDMGAAQSPKPIPPPPLAVAAVNMRCAINPKTLQNEIVMISCLTHTRYALDKQPPKPPFEHHFCVLTCPKSSMMPLDFHKQLGNYKATKVQKMDSEKALLNYFINQFSRIDPDLVVGHDLQGYQINVLFDRLKANGNAAADKIGRMRRADKLKNERVLFVGRLVCDLKISAKELIKSRSYDLDALCSAVLKVKEGLRVELEPEDVPKMYQTSENILKLVSFTMQDTSYILQIIYDLNVIPLALQITNIAGNVMSRTLMGGRSERNEFLLLHAFSEKDYIVPDKEYKKFNKEEKKPRKKPTYSGGLVLDPKIGFYDQLILLMDFNSLYPSIIQEYNICFTTMSANMDEENMVLPDKNSPPGILPTEIRKLVESRREVKKLMNNSDISNDLRMTYNIRQMALKLTANSMYGCLGFSNSRFYAKNLAALVTQKGREILTNTRDLVQKMCFEVVYGDTDSIMINTNCLDYDQVMKIGVKIKQEVNKLYKQVELDIDGVFKYLLLLKKKKYAAVTLSKLKSGELKAEKEYKGLDIVRRDWSQLACEAGKFILEHILSDQNADDRINNIHSYLGKIKEDLQDNKVPVQLLVITKALTKDPKMYTDKNSLPHVQVALRYNQQHGGHMRAGDTVPYVVCDDGSGKQATQRAYHIDELKNSKTLKIDVQYYLSQQIHPVVSRICDPIEGTDAFQIAECLGLDTASFKRPAARSDNAGENATRPEVKFRDVDKFRFSCFDCKHENAVDGALVGNAPFLEKCGNVACSVRPIQYLPFVQNQLAKCIRGYIKKYYRNELTCEDPACTNDTRRLPMKFAGKYPVCTLCRSGVMYRKYSESNLYSQLTYFQHIFDLSKLNKKPLMEDQIERGYTALRETVEKYLNHSGYSVINLTELFSGIFVKNNHLNPVKEEVEDVHYDEEDF